MEGEQKIIAAVREDEWMMDILAAAKTLELPDWWICAGFLRSKMWDEMHRYEYRTPLGRYRRHLFRCRQAGRNG